MAMVKVSVVLLTVFLQSLLTSNAKPLDSCCGGIPPCPAPALLPPPISFAPVPQPVPVRVPVPRPQSVTIPNIILALLPPTPKPVAAARPSLPPVPKPWPIVLPLPQPYAVPVPDCGYAPPACGC